MFHKNYNDIAIKITFQKMKIERGGPKKNKIK